MVTSEHGAGKQYEGAVLFPEVFAPAYALAPGRALLVPAVFQYLNLSTAGNYRTCKHMLGSKDNKDHSYTSFA
jgi:hypothetical protein